MQGPCATTGGESPFSPLARVRPTHEASNTRLGALVDVTDVCKIRGRFLRLPEVGDPLISQHARLTAARKSEIVGWYFRYAAFRLLKRPGRSMRSGLGESLRGNHLSMLRTG